MHEIIDMKTHDNSVNNAVSLSYLLIETEAFQFQQNAQARLFSNGVQTCVVLITLQARNSNGEVVAIPNDLNVNAVPYTSATGNWVSTMTPAPNGILAFPEHIIPRAEAAHSTPLSGANPENLQTFRRYISYTGIPDGTTIQFAAQVKLGNTTYISNQRDVPYGGEGLNGRFNSSFILRSVQPPHYATYNGGLIISGPVEVFSGQIGGYTTKVRNSYASLRYPGTSTAINIHSGSTSAADSSLHDNKATAFGDAGSTVAKKNIPTTNRLGQALNQALSTIRDPRAGSIAVAVGMFSQFNELFPARQTSHYGGATDVYGNPIRLAVTLTSIQPNRDPWNYQLSIEWAGNQS
ncbi:hypothetical protein RGV33_19530 [Pseudomonas sp. Bout1]|uniref:hypothetical protein n=1 Tax=Pseudomonas sp. Bout1 TaxID=3048600 RepID=UPI002AB49192|nr:hypothetical protein [Pseudomonas sp. Bout1]MDY7533851.1 hypothetical protein [Pseudomonas sp. Bout1]MEB0188897.1 hypothetical protein [Pseudomonas sp. Bout1]